MSTQTEFNDQIAAITAALATLSTKISEEAQQIRDFIAGLPPELDTSALNGVGDNLTALAANVEAIFVPPAEPETEPEA